MQTCQECAGLGHKNASPCVKFCKLAIGNNISTWYELCINELPVNRQYMSFIIQ